jgi:hypothetical protein
MVVKNGFLWDASYLKGSTQHVIGGNEKPRKSEG